MHSRTAIRTCAAWLALASASLSEAPPAPKIIYAPFGEVEPILETMRDALPPELKAAGANPAVAWNTWAKRRDLEIRSRLAQGDEDTLVNLLLFGTSFTKQPRVSPAELFQLSNQGQTAARELSEKGATIRARADDLIAALATAQRNDRIQFARALVRRRGLSLASPSGREQVKQFLLSSLKRVLSEQASYAQTLAAARQLGDATAEFAERSKLYKQRGLSLDTSLKPDFAIAESLREMQRRGLLAKGSVRRVAVIGPGLDFTDKDAGYDFYPPQTVQPFALLDTLVRLGLSRPDSIELTTLDISPRINEHIGAARARSLRGAGYVIQLPRDPARAWKPELVEYWKHLGEQIGAPATPAAAPGGSGVVMRAVRVRPDVVLRMHPADLNIVLQRLELSAGERFDLVVATNVFVYYDEFEQSLALANVQSMLRPGGFLLTNNVLLELPSSAMHSVDYLTMVYSDTPDDGDQLVWYRREK